jgi:phage-related protein
MGKTIFRIRYVLILATLGALLSFGTGAVSQTTPAQNPPAQPNPDITRTELANFDQFLDNHPETAEQLRKDPSLINDKDFIKTHTELQEFLEQHPGVREELRENPNQFMHREQRFDRREDVDRDRQQDQDLDRDRQQNQGDQDRQQDIDRDRQQGQNINRDRQQDQDADRDRQANNQRRDNDTTRRELANFDRFLDTHPEIAEQLRKDPSLVNDRKFVKSHDALADYLDSHPGVKEEYRENPNRFMSQEQQFERHEDVSRRPDNDVTRRELANFDRFLDTHPEIAEQLRKDPSLVNDKKFVQKHEPLENFLQQNAGVREEFKENPNAFMRQEQRFDQRQDGMQGFDRHQGGMMDRDAELHGFGEFLGTHNSIAQQLAKNPSLAQNGEFVANHPDFQAYLKAHPAVQAQLKQNPDVVLQTVQQQNAVPKSTPSTTPHVDPKPKQ